MLSSGNGLHPLIRQALKRLKVDDSEIVLKANSIQNLILDRNSNRRLK